MIYNSLRDANDLEHTLMSICPQWHAALQTHLFWNQAVACIDPSDAMQAQTQTKLGGSGGGARMPTPWLHFRSITRSSCIVCRLNAPNTTLGLGTAKRLLRTPYLHAIALCREHDKHHNSFCGMCLRAVPPVLHGHAALQHQLAVNAIALAPNDDPNTFPSAVATTCRACRMEYLSKASASHSSPSPPSSPYHPSDPHPTTKPTEDQLALQSPDWEVRAVVEAFLDLGEG
ncbi:hypothetical protein H0H87_012305, partial [Tephrocybe sp. NHM501043]